MAIIDYMTEDWPVQSAGEGEITVISTDRTSLDTAAANVMTAYQNANKWLDTTKEFVYSKLGMVFFSSWIHALAHTMPGRFDKFGDALHTINMTVPYPATEYIPEEPKSVDEVFSVIFNCLDGIKTALNEFIKVTDENCHGLACSAEDLLTDIEGEYPMLYKLQDQWKACEGDLADFDKYVGQYCEHKDDLLESLTEAAVGDFFKNVGTTIAHPNRVANAGGGKRGAETVRAEIADEKKIAEVAKKNSIDFAKAEAAMGEVNKALKGFNGMDLTQLVSKYIMKPKAVTPDQFYHFNGEAQKKFLEWPAYKVGAAQFLTLNSDAIPKAVKQMQDPATFDAGLDAMCKAVATLGTTIANACKNNRYANLVQDPANFTEAALKDKFGTAPRGGSKPVMSTDKAIKSAAEYENSLLTEAILGKSVVANQIAPKYVDTALTECDKYTLLDESCSDGGVDITPLTAKVAQVLHADSVELIEDVDPAEGTVVLRAEFPLEAEVDETNELDDAGENFIIDRDVQDAAKDELKRKLDAIGSIQVGDRAYECVDYDEFEITGIESSVISSAERIPGDSYEILGKNYTGDNGYVEASGKVIVRCSIILAFSCD